MTLWWPPLVPPIPCSSLRLWLPPFSFPVLFSPHHTVPALLSRHPCGYRREAATLISSFRGKHCLSRSREGNSVQLCSYHCVVREEKSLHFLLQRSRCSLYVYIRNNKSWTDHLMYETMGGSVRRCLSFCPRQASDMPMEKERGILLARVAPCYLLT